MSELLQYGKTTIKIPEQMMLIKNGKETLQDVITKTGNLTTRNKEKSIKFETTKSNTISIKTVPVEIKHIPEIKKKEEPKVKKVNDTDLIYQLKQLEKEYYNYYDILEIKKTASGKKRVSMAGRETPSSIKSKYDTINKKIKNKQPELLSADEYKKEGKKEEKRQKEEDKRKEAIEKVRQEEMRKNSSPTEEFGFIDGKRLYKKKTVAVI